MREPRLLAGLRVLLVGLGPPGPRELLGPLLEAGASVSVAARMPSLTAREADVIIACGASEIDAILRICAAIRESANAPIVVCTGGPAAPLLGPGDVADEHGSACAPSQGERPGLLAALAGRAESATSDELLGPGGLVVRRRAHEAAILDTPLHLGPKEFEILSLLLERRGEVLSADAISIAVWGHQTFGGRNYVEAHIARLRAKLRQAGAPEIIKTIRGVGYVIR